MTTVLIAGLGGQGVILAGDILARAAMHEGLEVKKSEIHGMSQRGGSVFSFVRFDRQVFSPVPRQGDVDVMIALELTEALRWRHFLHAGSSVAALDLYAPSYGRGGMGEGPVRSEIGAMRSMCGWFLTLDPDLLSREGRTLPANTALLGVISPHLPLGREAWLTAIGMSVKAEFVDVNESAFEFGAGESERGGAAEIR